MYSIPSALLTRQNLNILVETQQHPWRFRPSDFEPDVQVLWDAVQQHRTEPQQVLRDSNLHRWVIVDLLSSLYTVHIADNSTAMGWVLDPTCGISHTESFYSLQAIQEPHKTVALAIRVAGNVGSRTENRAVWETQCQLRCDLLCSIGHVLPAPTQWHNCGVQNRGS